jgi:hypothetical protein
VGSNATTVPIASTAGFNADTGRSIASMAGSNAATGPIASTTSSNADTGRPSTKEEAHPTNEGVGPIAAEEESLRENTSYS